MFLSVVFAGQGDRVQVRSARVTLDPLAGLPAALAPDEEVAAIFWPKSAMLDLDGAPLSDALLSASRAVIAGVEPPAGLGGCARCLAPSGDAPATIFPGDLCPPPSFALTRLADREATAAEREAFQRQLTLAWPGACACPSVPPRPSAVRLQAEALLPERGARASRLIAVDDRGAIVAAAEDRVFPFAPSGDAFPAIRDGELFDRIEGLLTIPPGPGFDGGFLLVHSRFEPHGSLYELVTVTDSGASRQDLGGPELFPADAAAALGGGEILLLGEIEKDLRAERCTVAGSPPRLDCRSEVPCPGSICPLIAGLRVSEVEAGLLVVGDGVGVMLRPAAGPQWRSTRLMGLGRAGDQPHFSHATLLGDRFWGCLHFDRGDQLGALVTATASGAWPSSTPATEVFRYDRRDPDTATTCESLWPDPSRGVVWMESHRPGPGHRWVRVEVDGTLTSSRAFSDRPLLRFDRDASGWSAMSARDGSIFRRSPSAREPVQLTGPAVPARGRPAAIAREDGVIIVGDDRRLIRLGLGAEPPASLAQLQLTPLDLTLPAEADTLQEILLPDASPQGVIRVVQTETILVIDRVDVVSGRTTRVLSRPVPSRWPLKAVVPWRDLVLLLFTSPDEPGLWSWRPGAPDISRVEGAPPASGIASTSGAAFLWGRGPSGADRLVRARRAGDEVVLDELPLDSVARGDQDPAPGARWVRDLRAVCPDTLEILAVFGADTALLRLCLSGACGGEAAGEMSPALTTLIPRDRVVDPQVVAGPWDDALVVNGEGHVASARGRLGAMPFFPQYAVIPVGQRLFLLAGVEGAVAIGSPE